jgi:hypothetical protein
LVTYQDCHRQEDAPPALIGATRCISRSFPDRLCVHCLLQRCYNNNEDDFHALSIPPNKLIIIVINNSSINNDL